MRLTTAGAQMYISTSHITLAYGALTWEEYLLRLRFIRDSTEPGALEARVAADILLNHEFEGMDEWTADGAEQSGSVQGPIESQVSFSDRQTPFEIPLIAFIASGSTGLHEWQFQLADPDFFPSIPHGHWRSEKWKRLDVYRGWIYQEDKQTGREPRWKIIALWNDEKFRSFACAAIQYYLDAYPRFVWRVAYPLKLPRRR